jgi:hypothetical protein
MNKVIHLLFLKGDLSLVKVYLEKQWGKLEMGNLEEVDLFLKDKLDKDPSKSFLLPDTEELVSTAKRQLTNVLNRIFHIFGTEIGVWMKERTITRRYATREGLLGYTQLKVDKVNLKGDGKGYENVVGELIKRSKNLLDGLIE